MQSSVAVLRISESFLKGLWCPVLITVVCSKLLPLIMNVKVLGKKLTDNLISLSVVAAVILTIPTLSLLEIWETLIIVRLTKPPNLE